MSSILESILDYHKEIIKYYETRSLSLGIPFNEYELSLSPDCPYYSDGLRGLKVSKQKNVHGEYYDFSSHTYILYVDLSFFTSSLFSLNFFKSSLDFEYYFFVVVSNENNLSNLFLDLSTYSKKICHYYFQIDMSSNCLSFGFKTEKDLEIEFYEYLSWLSSGVHIELSNYTILFTNYHYGHHFDIIESYQLFLDNFHHLYLTKSSSSPLCLSSNYFNEMTVHLDIYIGDNVEDFTTFLSYLDDLLYDFEKDYDFSRSLYVEVVSLKEIDDIYVFNHNLFDFGRANLLVYTLGDSGGQWFY